ncbi:MAG: apolipoprotein N-acyltransferase [Candidatus Aminicenantia bacterium]
MMFLLTQILPSISSGVLTYISFERLSLVPFAWFSLSIPFFILISKRKNSFLIGFFWALSFYSLSLYWLIRVMFHYGNLPNLLSILFFLLLVSGLSALFGLLFLLNSSIYLHRPVLQLLLFPISWVSLEYILSFFLTGFPWNLIGYSQVHFLPLVQISSFTGVYGVSFLIVFLNSSIAFAIKERNIKWIVPSLCLFILSLIFGIYTIEKGYSGENPVKSAVIQGNTSMDDELIGNEALLEKKFSEYIELTEKAINQGSKLIIWPETSVPILFRYDLRREKIFEISNKNNVFILVSFTDWRNGKFYNSTFLIAPQFLISSVYDKIHLVPFGEYVPIKKILGFFESITREVGDYTPGQNLVLHSIEEVKFASPICYEIIFPDLVRKFVKKGAQFLVTVSNDGWFGKSVAPYQHFSIAVMRCVENRRFLLRATSTGVSGIVDPFGRVLKKIGLEEKRFEVEEIYPIKEKTFYSNYGDIFSKTCLTITSFSFILSIWRKHGIRRGKKRA